MRVKDGEFINIGINGGALLQTDKKLEQSGFLTGREYNDELNAVLNSFESFIELSR